jgi:DNA processing protein
MTRSTLSSQEIRSAVAGVTPIELDDQETRERFARAAWTGITEPGDAAAGTVISAIGAGVALEGLIEGWSAEQFALEALDGGVSLEGIDIDAALAQWLPRVTSTGAMTAFEQAARCGATLLTPADDEWPAGLADLGTQGPIALWVRGNIRHLRTLGESIGVCGARAATGYGEHVTMEAAAGLVDRGYAVASGAAYGIDGMAHRAALASGGVTIAFLAGGVDRFYPSGHDALLTRIVETGAVVSEIPCGSAPTKWRFVSRNRLIAATTSATVIVEAGWRSGSLNIAGHAAALGRPVGAVPGPVTSAASAGCHRLLREGLAQCVTNADEMAELAPRRVSVAA